MSLSPSPTLPLETVLPAELAPFLGPAPLVRGEDGAVYDGLFAQIVAGLKPRDVFEWLWVRDVVDAAWDAARMRRLRASLLTLGQELGVVQVLHTAGLASCPGPQGELVPAEEAAQAYAAGDLGFIDAIERALAKRGFLREAIEAQSLRANLARLETIDRMIAAADQRRDQVLREVERRRAGFAAQLRARTDMIDLPAGLPDA